MQDPVRFHEAWKALCKTDGVIVPGGFGTRGVEGKMEAAHWCRVNNIPYLGVCLGLQIAVIEFARNVLGRGLRIRSSPDLFLPCTEIFHRIRILFWGLVVMFSQQVE